MRTIVDDSGYAESIIRRALTRSLHSDLISETTRMVEAGADIEDVVWLLGPGVGFADRRQDSLAYLEESFPDMSDLIRDLPPRIPGRMLVVYIGPEGIFAQRWQSILTATKASAS